MLKTCLYKKLPVTFSDTGKGRVVVLLHGYLGSHKIWEQTILNLSKVNRVIAIDLPGHGNTSNYGYAHSMELMAKCVKAVVENLKIKKFSIVGHSMGGYVALAFADLFPDYLTGLCLYHSTAFADTAEKKKDRLRAINAIKANKNVYTKSTIKNLFATKNLKYLKEAVSFATDIAKGTSKAGMIAALHGMKDRPNREIILSLVKYPILIVIGEHDNVLPNEQLLEQFTKIKNGTKLYLEHDGHFGFLESPLESNKALRKFIRKCYK